MDITFNPQIALNSVNGSNKIRPNFFIQDKINFTGQNVLKSENMQEAEDFGLNLFALLQNGKFSIKNVKEQGRKNIPILEVDKISNLGKILNTDTSRYRAYTLPEYGKHCELKKLTLFAPDEIQKPQNIGSIAHEYTHCLQRYKSGSYLGLEKYTNGDLLQTRVLNNLSAIVFSNLEKSLKVSELVSKTSSLENLGMSPKEALYSAYECKDEKEFKKLSKKLFLAIYDDVLQEMTKDPEVRKYLPLLNSPLQLKKIVREQCKLRANMEMEAYSVQKNVIQQIDPSLVSDENKFNPIFYSAIYESLS